MQEKIKVESLTAEIKAALGEVFVAQVTESQGEIRLKFINGQEFILSVKETETK